MSTERATRIHNGVDPRGLIIIHIFIASLEYAYNVVKQAYIQGRILAALNQRANICGSSERTSEMYGPPRRGHRYPPDPPDHCYI